MYFSTSRMRRSPFMEVRFISPDSTAGRMTWAACPIWLWMMSTLTENRPPASKSRPVELEAQQASLKETPIERLTPRERDILDALAEGLSSKQIAQREGLSVRTVETHRLNLRKKLGIETPAGLIRYALQQGWIKV